jgi:hypothetical protein
VAPQAAAEVGGSAPSAVTPTTTTRLEVGATCGKLLQDEPRYERRLARSRLSPSVTWMILLPCVCCQRPTWRPHVGGQGIELVATMGRQAVVLYVIALIAVVVGVDVLFFSHQFLERLIVNVGIVLAFGAFYLRFLKRP